MKPPPVEPTFAGIYCTHGAKILCDKCRAELKKHIVKRIEGKNR